MLKAPKPYRRRKRLDYPVVSPPPPPPPAFFWQVQTSSDNLTWAIWNVYVGGAGGTIDDPGNINQYTVNGQHPSSIVEVAGDEVTFEYPDNIHPGDPWQFIPGLPAADTTPPAPLAPESGTVL